MDSLDVKMFATKTKDMKVVFEMRHEINVSRECLKTSDLVINRQSKAIERLTEALELSVDQIPMFKTVLGLIKDLEESTQRDKDHLQTLMASLVETNLQKVDELIGGRRQCAATSDQCVQIEEECEESVDMVGKSEPMIDTIGVQSFDAEYEPTVKTESTGDCVDRESETVESNNSCVTIDSETSDSETEVTAKTSNCGGCQTPGSERKIVTTNETPIDGSMATTSAHTIQWRRVVSTSGNQNTIPMYACHWPKCTYTTKHSYHMKSHINAHKKVKPYVCQNSGCQYRTGNSSHLKRHQRCHQKDPNYRLHSFPIHIESSDSESEVTANSAGVGTSGTHSRRQTQGSGCSERKCLTTNGTPIKRSMATTSAHRSERPLHRREVVSAGRKPAKRYACERPDCGHTTSDRKDMTDHVNRHNNVRPFGCDECEYRAVHSGDLNKHKRRHQNNPNFRPYSRLFSRLATD